MSKTRDDLKWSHLDKSFASGKDGYNIAELLLGLLLVVPERLGYSVAHKSSVQRSMPSKPEVFQLKTHIRFARKQGDAAFPERKKRT